MTDKNRLLYIIFIALTAMALLVTVLLVVLIGEGDFKREYLMGVFPTSVIVCACFIIAPRFAQYGRNYTLRKEEGRLRFVRKLPSPDPLGMRPAGYAIASFILALFFMFVTLDQIVKTGYLPFQIVAVLLINQGVAVMLITERKILKYNKGDF